MSNRITLDELQNYLWNSAVLLRTNIDAGAYKQYIFPLLFFKRVCDVYDEETEQAIREFGDDINDFDEDELHAFIIPKGYHWNDVRQVTENVGSALVEAFHAIEKSNIDLLQGIFGDGAWTNKNRLPDSLLKDLLEHFSSKTLSLANCPEDELGQGYEYLIKKFADDSGHTAQEFYTNRTVVHLMTEILEPNPNDSIYDPTCGSAGMLISCIAHLKAKGKEWRSVKVFGQEINQLTSAIGRMNLFLHGIKDFNIANDDTLSNPQFVENNKLKTFDLVLANPPYSISQWNREAFIADKYGRNEFGVPPQSRADFAFIQHIIKSMDPTTGRCAILLPHGVLNRTEEQSIRRKIVETDCIETVIGLGRHLFYNSGLESCILVCRNKKRPERQNHIQFIDAEKCLHMERSQNYLYPQDINKIMTAYRSDSSIQGFSRLVSLEEVLQNDGNLNIKLYVRKNERKEDVSLDDMADAWNSYFEQTELVHDNISTINYGKYAYSNTVWGNYYSQEIDKSSWKKVKLEDVADEYSVRVEDPSQSEFKWYIGSDCIDGFDFRVRRRTPSEKIKSAQKMFKVGDYLLVRRSLYGSDFRERAPRADFDGVCSADILTIREKPEAVYDGFLIGVLYSRRLWESVVANSTGSLTRRIKWKQLKEFEFLLPPPAQQKKITSLLWSIYSCRKAYQDLLKESDRLLEACFYEMTQNSGSKNTLGDFAKKCKAEKSKGEDLPVLSITKENGIVFQSEKFNKRIASENTAGYKVVPKGKLVQGIHIDEGNFAIQNIADKGIVSPAYKIWDVDDSRVIPELLSYALRSTRSIEYFKSKFQGSTVQRRQTISDKDLLNTPLNFPGIEEQKLFYEEMLRIENSKNEISKTIDTLWDIYRIVMTLYFD